MSIHDHTSILANLYSLNLETIVFSYMYLESLYFHNRAYSSWIQLASGQSLDGLNDYTLSEIYIIL